MHLESDTLITFPEATGRTERRVRDPREKLLNTLDVRHHCSKDDETTRGAQSELKQMATRWGDSYEWTFNSEYFATLHLRWRRLV